MLAAGCEHLGVQNPVEAEGAGGLGRVAVSGEVPVTVPVAQQPGIDHPLLGPVPTQRVVAQPHLSVGLEGRCQQLPLPPGGNVAQVDAQAAARVGPNRAGQLGQATGQRALRVGARRGQQRRTGGEQGQVLGGRQRQRPTERLAEAHLDLVVLVDRDVDQGVRRVGVHADHEHNVEVGEQVVAIDAEALGHLGDGDARPLRHPRQDRQNASQPVAGGDAGAHGDPSCPAIAAAQTIRSLRAHSGAMISTRSRWLST